MAASLPSVLPTHRHLTSEINKRKLLLGEGIDEVNFFNALLNHLGIIDIQVEQYGGRTRFRPVLAALVRQRTFRDLISLGVTRDADNDSLSAFASISAALRDQGLVSPS